MRPLAPECRRWARTLGDLIFPPLCVHCDALVETAGAFRHLCGRCAASVARVSAPHCQTCGHPFFGEVTGGRECPHCRGLQPAFREGFTAVLFRGPARSLVIALKYHHGLHVLTDMETLIRESPEVGPRVRGAVLVPVPLHGRKLRERGYNQSRLLADVLARVGGGDTRVKELLRRVEDSQTQTAFDRRTRLANLKNAFALAPGARIVADQHYILVDDVFTTGSTLNRCAQVLRESGARVIDVVTFGHG